MIFKRTYAVFPITDPELTRRQMLTWAFPFNICCFLDSQGYTHSGYASVPAEGPGCLLAAGCADSFVAAAGNAFTELKAWSVTRRDWLFGHFAYDLVSETESVQATDLKTDHIGFPDLFFFVPEVVIELRTDIIRIGVLEGEPATIWKQIEASHPAGIGSADRRGSSSGTTGNPRPAIDPVAFAPRFTREEYLATVAALQRHILRGDCYEINFCQEFYSWPTRLDPLDTWLALSSASPNPFSAYYRLDHRYLFCASPERYLKKTGHILYSQPIKGTAPRETRDDIADESLRKGLYDSPKDRAENVMVVDLVRNDLARICLPGSVKVDELFGVYTFPQVHQLISTIKGELPPDFCWPEAIRATFPMGSMTGAPKNRVVQLIDRYERSRRGLFSGAVGYVTPLADFDFNVVIRSLLYNQTAEYLSYQVGSGITFYSDPGKEYEECLVKAEGIRKALELTGR
jgi:para-aminobenzoate synthetase component 1